MAKEIKALSNDEIICAKIVNIAIRASDLFDIRMSIEDEFELRKELNEKIDAFRKYIEEKNNELILKSGGQQA